MIPWREVEDVVAMANDSHYGLAAYGWSAHLDKAITAHRIESGWVQVNQGGGQVVGQSYGGYNQSGIGREFLPRGRDRRVRPDQADQRQAEQLSTTVSIVSGGVLK